MHIPDPVLIPVNVDLSHLSWWGQFKYVVKNPPLFRLGEDYIIFFDDENCIVVPAGEETDLASVPRIFWWIPGFSPVGYLRYGAIPHDFGYKRGFLLSIDDKGVLVKVCQDWTQDQYDELLRKITIEKTGVRFVANIAYRMLRRYGHVAWNRYRKKQKRG